MFIATTHQIDAVTLIVLLAGIMGVAALIGLSFMITASRRQRQLGDRIARGVARPEEVRSLSVAELRRRNETDPDFDATVVELLIKTLR